MSSVRELRGDDVAARDGSVGSVEDVYFDEQHWAVKYFLVDAGERLPGRRMLIPPDAVEPGLSSGRKIRLGLTRAQVEDVRLAEEAAAGSLRSGLAVIGYGIEARDGAIGEVQDLTVDEETWAIRDVVVDTLKWWPGGLVHVHPEYVERIDPRGRTVHLLLTRDEVKLSSARSPRR